MSIQQIRASARKTIHDFFSVEVTYTPVTVGETPFPTTARIHMVEQPVESGEWSSRGYATMIEQAEYLIFDASEVTPLYGDKITVIDDSSEYRIERTHKPYGGYVKCEVV